jgi:hypothetical protein
MCAAHTIVGSSTLRPGGGSARVRRFFMALG